MFSRLEQFRDFMGEGRFWVFVGLLGSTGIASFVLAITGQEQTVALQSLLAISGISGSLFLVISRMDRQQRINWLAILLPAFGLVVIGVMFFPQYQLPLMGAAFGWLMVALTTFTRSTAPMQYQQAIKALRKGDYKTGVEAMDALIRIEQENPNHYRLRGRILRLWGKTGRARRDYESMIQYASDDALRAEAYNELAELELGAKNYDAALLAAQKAFDLLPEDWVAAYNLGMIQDRLGRSEEVIISLKKAIEVNITDARHRLLVAFWLLRAYARLGQEQDANAALLFLKEHKGSLAEWQKILESEDAELLRAVLAADIDLIQQVIAGSIAPMELASK